jgi:hypothetical protein
MNKHRCQYWGIVTFWMTVAGCTDSVMFVDYGRNYDATKGRTVTATVAWINRYPHPSISMTGNSGQGNLWEAGNVLCNGHQAGKVTRLCGDFILHRAGGTAIRGSLAPLSSTGRGAQKI